MAELDESRIRHTHHNHDFKCPFCQDVLDVVTEIEVKPYISSAGSNSFKKFFSVNSENKIVKVTINHECGGPPEREEDRR